MAASGLSVVKSIKELNWTHISVTAKTGLKGAVMNYTSDNGSKLAVGFGSNLAYLLVDDAGAFEAADLEGLIKDKSVDMADPRSIEGVVALAIVGDGHVDLNEDNLNKYGLNALEVVDSIKKRLISIDQLNSMVDVQV